MLAETERASLQGFCEDLVAERRPEPVPPESMRALRETLRAEGLSGLASRAIERGALALPEEVADGVREDWVDARRWSAMLDLECARIGRAGGAGDGNPPILLKGRSAARLWRDPALRAYGDVDLLVPPAEIGAWGRALAGLGYRPPPPWEQRSDLRYSHHLSYRRPLAERSIPCELHWSLFIERRARALGYAALRPHAEPSAIPGLLHLAPPAELVVLAVHLAHHARGTRRAAWIVDLIEMGASEAVAEARVIAASNGVGWALERALHEAQAVLREPR